MDSHIDLIDHANVAQILDLTHQNHFQQGHMHSQQQFILSLQHKIKQLHLDNHVLREEHRKLQQNFTDALRAKDHEIDKLKGTLLSFEQELKD